MRVLAGRAGEGFRHLCDPKGRELFLQIAGNIILIVTCILLVAACGATRAIVSASRRDPRGFVAHVDNPWFPLRPGSNYTYRGVKDGKPAVDVFTVTNRTRRIDGAPCVAVSDRLYLRGRLEERTTDWYTQDKRGNVWYFGEATAELDRTGKVKNTEGSWQAGKDGAEPGIFMSARPRVGQSFRQEYYKGQAEDHFQVLELAAHVSVPFTRTSKALLTKEWTPLEPAVTDHKYYVRGVGTVLENAVRGPKETLRLVSFTK
jgi:hypothetical protein